MSTDDQHGPTVSYWQAIAEQAQAEAKQKVDDWCALKAQLEAAEGEVTRLSELLWGSRCVYCGEVVGKDKQNQDVADEVLRKHVLACPKHPVADLQRQLAQARAALEQVEVRSRKELTMPHDMPIIHSIVRQAIEKTTPEPPRGPAENSGSKLRLDKATGTIHRGEQDTGIKPEESNGF